MASNVRIRVLLNLCVGLTLFASCLSGFDLSFTAYALTLKETYNFTQTQVELAASFSAFGIGMCFLEVILNAWLGYKFLFALTWAILPGSSLFLSIAPSYRDYFHENPLSIYIALFLMIAAALFCFMSTTSIMVSALSTKHTGKFIGACSAMISLGRLFYGFLIETFFFHNLAGFFRTIFVLSLIVYTSTFLALHLLKIELSREDKSTCEINEHHKMEQSYSTQQKSVPLKEMISSLFFHLAFWSSLATYACTLTLVNNSTAIGESVGVPHVMVLLYIMSSIALAVKLFIGYIIDRFQSVRMTLVLLIITNISVCMSPVLGVLYLSTSTMYVFSVLLGVSLVGGYSIFVPLMALKFGKIHYRLLMGLFFGLITIFMFAVQVVLGLFYDSKATSNDMKENICIGSNCYHETFYIVFVVSCVAILCDIVLLVKEL